MDVVAYIVLPLLSMSTWPWSSLYRLSLSRAAQSPNVRATGWILASSILVSGAFHALAPLRSGLRQWNDFAFVYAAGRAWAHGHSPYDVVRWRAEWAAIRPSFLSRPPSQPFLYPPYWAVLAVPLAFLPWPIAERFWDLVNVGAYTAACFFSLTLLLRERPRALEQPLTWALVGLAAWNGATRWCIWECQLAMVSFAGVAGAFWAFSEKKVVWLAVFSFIAVLKPQIAFLPLFSLLLMGGARGVLAGALVALLASVFALSGTSAAELVEQLRNDYRLHMAIAFNAPDRFCNFSALLAALDPQARLTRLSPLVGMAIVPLATGIWRPFARDRGQGIASPLWALALSLAWTAALVPLHGYDLVIYTPVILLVYVVRPLWIAGVVLVLALTASRFTNAVHLGPIVPYATLTIAVAMTAAWRFARS